MRSAIPMSRSLAAVVASLLLFALCALPAAAQQAATTDAIIEALAKLETPSDLESAALRQLVADRVKAKTDPVALKRPLIAPALLRLPHLNFDIQFNPDTPVIRPESYRTIGRIADALASPPLLSYIFLIVGRAESTGRRDNNLILSQRRAEAIRDSLVLTFKISQKRVLAVGLGEEQLLDANNPKAAVNVQSSIVTLREVEPVAGSGAVKPVEAGRAKKSGASRSAGKAGK